MLASTGVLALATAGFLSQLDALDNHIDQRTGSATATYVAIGSLSVGAVAWTVRSSTVWNTGLSLTLAWRALDPLVVLRGGPGSKRKRRRKPLAASDGSLRSLAASLPPADLPPSVRDDEVRR